MQKRREHARHDGGAMTNLPDDIRFPDGPMDHQEIAEDWARRVGERDGERGISEEGRAALNGESYERRAQITQTLK